MTIPSNRQVPRLILATVACTLMGLGVLATAGCTFSGASAGGAPQNAQGIDAVQKATGDAGSRTGAEPPAQSASPSEAQPAASEEVTSVETPYYTLKVPAGALEEGWSTSFDDTLTGDTSSGMGGHWLRVFTPSSGDEPFLTVLQYSGDWFGLQHDQGEFSTSTAFSTEVDGIVWNTVVMGGPYGDYGPMTLEESLEFTESWARNVVPA